jgi:hypothetical protein
VDGAQIGLSEVKPTGRILIVPHIGVELIYHVGHGEKPRIAKTSRVTLELPCISSVSSVVTEAFALSLSDNSALHLGTQLAAGVAFQR